MRVAVRSGVSSWGYFEQTAHCGALPPFVAQGSSVKPCGVESTSAVATLAALTASPRLVDVAEVVLVAPPSLGLPLLCPRQRWREVVILPVSTIGFGGGPLCWLPQCLYVRFQTFSNVWLSLRCRDPHQSGPCGGRPHVNGVGGSSPPRETKGFVLCFCSRHVAAQAERVHLQWWASGLSLSLSLFFLQVKGACQAPRPVGPPNVLGLSGRHYTYRDTYQDGFSTVREISLSLSLLLACLLARRLENEVPLAPLRSRATALSVVCWSA